MSGNKLIIDAVYNLNDDDGFLQVGINDGKNKAQVNSNGSLKISDLDAFSFMNRMLKELKIMNIHLSLLTDNEIKYTEVE